MKHSTGHSIHSMSARHEVGPAVCNMKMIHKGIQLGQAPLSSKHNNQRAAFPTLKQPEPLENPAALTH